LEKSLSILKEHFSLKSYNSFGFDVSAKYFCEICSVEDLLSIIKNPIFNNCKKLILSGGNNILFCEDEYDGLIIYVNNKGIEVLEDNDGEIVLRAQAGEDWCNFVKYCVANGFYGLENLAHIPGKVGASPVQNIGAYGVELKDCFFQCDGIDLNTGVRRRFSKDECCFGYRSSVFKTKLKGQYVIVSVDFKLKKHAELKLDYGNIKDYLLKHSIDFPSLMQLHDAICEIRDAKLPDVSKIGNAGSFFKNPVIDNASFETFIQKFPDAPRFMEPGGRHKIPAGWLIEKAGWKGFRNEHVGVYDKQALVLVHYGNGRGKDIVSLSEKIQQSVLEHFGIFIEAEVNFV
jgi:UDP-N-acetylenolpyruvoylglucosamine reductase